MPTLSKSEQKRSTFTFSATRRDCTCSTLDSLADACFCAAPCVSVVGSANPFEASSSHTDISTTSSTSPRSHAKRPLGLPLRVSTPTTTQVIHTTSDGRESRVAWKASAEPFYPSTHSFPTAGSTTATSSMCGTACGQFISPDILTDIWASTASVTGSYSAPICLPAIAALPTSPRTSSTPRRSKCQRVRLLHCLLTSPGSFRTIVTVLARKNTCNGFANCSANPNSTNRSAAETRRTAVVVGQRLGIPARHLEPERLPGGVR